MRITLRQLRYFVTIARERTLSRASDRLGVAQPALSQNLASLEDALGAPLFARHAKGVTLLPTGQRLLGEAQRLLDEVDLLPALVAGEGAQPRGRVRVAIAGSLSGVIVAPLLGLTAERLPRVELVLTDGLSLDVRRQLQAGTLDLALMPGASGLYGVESEPLLEEHFLLFGAPEVMAHLPQRLTLAQALAQPLVALDRSHDLRQLIERAAESAGLQPKVVNELNSPPMLMSVAATGRCCTIMPFGPSHDAMASGALAGRPIAARQLSRVQSLVWPTAKVPDPAVDAVRGLLIEVVRTALRKGLLRGRVLVPSHKKN